MDSGQIRVLVADDSALMRRLVSDVIESDSRFAVVGTARDGREVVQNVDALRPDVVTLDIEMPVMDGLTALEEIMRRRPTPVVMLSSRTRHGAKDTMRSLELGAVDFVCKPSGSISMDVAKVKEMLLTKLRLAATARLMRTPVRRPGDAAAVPRTPRAPCAPAQRVVVIGSSTGGPRALEEVIPRLPAGLPACVLVAQHMPAGFTAAMAERLDGLSSIQVREARDGDMVARGRALIAPGSRHLLIGADGRVAVNDEPPLWGVKPAADILLSSAARAFGRRCVGVVLTGMGRDGARGLREIREAGGRAFAQDEGTCVVYGMPKAAVEEGAVEASVSLPRIWEKVVEALGLDADASSEGTSASETSAQPAVPGADET